jgi:hypothetical protein
VKEGITEDGRMEEEFICMSYIYLGRAAYCPPCISTLPTLSMNQSCQPLHHVIFVKF